MATIGTRLARGRVMLARRLASNGAVLSAGALAALLSQHVVSAAVPTALATSTIKIAAIRRVATGGMISTQVATLTDAVLKTMLLAKLKTLTAFMVAVTFLVGAGGFTCYTQTASRAA